MHSEDLVKINDQAVGRKKADFVLKNARYLDVFSGECRRADIAFCGGKIAGVGEYEGEIEEDASSSGIAVPGLIDSHVHIESTQLTPEEFARCVVPRGTAVVIADPHEIVNVCGLAGAEYMGKAAARTPLEVKLMLPSCVPATPFETSGASFDAADTAKALKKRLFYGLGEMMNYVGVASGDGQALGKMAAAAACGKVADGHAPSMRDKELNAYITSGAHTDHECATAEEAAEKVSKGMYVLLREGSASHDLERLASAVNSVNFRRFALCTDDRHADDLIAEGHMDHVLRTAVKSGIPSEIAVIMCTLNAAECYGLKGKGAIAPGYDADIAFFADLEDFVCKAVYKGGKCVAKDGKPLFSSAKRVPAALKNTVHAGDVSEKSFAIKLNGTRARVIGLKSRSLLTESLVLDVQSREGDVVLEGTDLVKLAVVERHFATGRVGLGLLKGYGIKGGAVATSVSHDSHNIIVAGDDSGSMLAAVKELERIGGGMAVVQGEKVYSVPLDVAGLMSSASAEKHAALSAELAEKAYSMGVSRKIEAFMTLSFLALAVLPELRVTDGGLFDVKSFGFVPLEADCNK